MKNRELLIKITYLLSLINTATGAFLKIVHFEGARTVMTIGIIFTVFFILSSIYEVNISKRIKRNEKIMWTVGLICISAIVGFVYVFNGRKRIV